MLNLKLFAGPPGNIQAGIFADQGLRRDFGTYYVRTEGTNVRRSLGRMGCGESAPTPETVRQAPGLPMRAFRNVFFGFSSQVIQTTRSVSWGLQRSICKRKQADEETCVRGIHLSNRHCTAGQDGRISRVREGVRHDSWQLVRQLQFTSSDNRGWGAYRLRARQCFRVSRCPQARR